MKTPRWFLHRNFISVLLVPFSWVYYGVSCIVFNIRKRKQISSSRPIVCVGNILAGGVGKTPIVREIATFFDAPVVMRGYKKSVQTGNIGDEATMLANAGLGVHVGDRKSNIILLNKQKQNNVPIVMDDGLQNPVIKKDVSIMVFDEGLGFGNGFMLPAGPLRQPQSAIKNADVIVVIKSKYVNKNFILPYGIPVFYAENKTISPYDENEKLVAFAGIGYPEKFFGALHNVVAKRAFPDHWQYTNQDIENLILLAEKHNAKLVTTEKDWVRLPEKYKNNIKYAKLVTVIETTFYNWLKEKIECQQLIKK
jgi:tetraacyldisaccharide 4'-kinase